MFYARFIDDTGDYVLHQPIASTIGKDRDFVEWRTAHASGTAPVSSERDRATPAATPTINAEPDVMRALLDAR